MQTLLKFNKIANEVFFALFFQLFFASVLIASITGMYFLAAQMILDGLDFIFNSEEYLQGRREPQTLIFIKRFFNGIKQHLTKEFFKKVLVGIGLGVSTFALKMALFCIGLYLYPPKDKKNTPDLKKDTDQPPAKQISPQDDLLDIFMSVVVAPIVEEIYFRGVMIPLIKGMVNIARHAIHTVANAAFSVYSYFNPRSTCQPTPIQEFEAGKEPCGDKVFAGFTSAIIFSNAHAPAARPSALIGGLMKSAIYEAYEGDLVPCIAQHMTNNAIAEVVSRVALRYA